MIRKEMTEKEKAERYDLIMWFFKRECNYEPGHGGAPDFMAKAMLNAELGKDVCVSYTNSMAANRFQTYCDKIGKPALAYCVDER